MLIIYVIELYLQNNSADILVTKHLLLEPI